MEAEGLSKRFRDDSKFQFRAYSPFRFQDKKIFELALGFGRSLFELRRELRSVRLACVAGVRRGREGERRAREARRSVAGGLR